MPSSYSSCGTKFAWLAISLSLACIIVGSPARAEDILSRVLPIAQNQSPPLESTEPGELAEPKGNRDIPPGIRSRIQERMRQRFQNRLQGPMKNRLPGQKNNAALGGHFGRGRPLDFSLLGLSDEQKEKIQNMRKALAPNARKLRQELKAKRDELRSLMFDPSASDSALKSKQREVHKTQEQLEDLQLNDFIQMRSLLSPEQRQKLPELKPEKLQPHIRQNGTPPEDIPHDKPMHDRPVHDGPSHESI